MRVLFVDQDHALLTAITHSLGEYFTIDAVTTKADCQDLVRVNEFEVIVTGERLEDGSGLELLAQMARSRPDMLRIFAVEPHRLKLLQGRLGPFGLFRTISYPIEPRQLVAALSAAAGFEEEEQEEAAQMPETSALPEVFAPSPEPTRVTAVARVQAQAPARPLAPAQTRSTPRADARIPRQPTPDALATGARLAATSRPRGFPPPRMELSARRSAFMVGAGVVLVIGTMALAFRLFDPDKPTVSMANIGVRSAKHYPPEVFKLIADTETDFQRGDFKAARTNIAALQQLAPDHPKLPSLESLLQQHEVQAKRSSHSSFAREASRHTAQPPASAKTGAAAAVTSPAGTPSTVQPPRLIEQVPAQYPDEATREGLEGAVDLSLTISPDGEVADVTVVHAVPSGIFDQAAIDAVRSWKYQPKTVDGAPVEANVQLRLVFKPDSKR